MENINQQQKLKTPIVAYMGYLFQSFLKRPFGYIIGTLYVVYLSVILLIVPSCLHFEPLFIWNVGGFNMPIFNLFFIAGAAASIAVSIFRTGRDDGTDLNLSAKPITKGISVGVKTIVYLIIMLILCLLTIFIVALIKPIFGTYNATDNIVGITDEKYKGILLSIFIGNLVNMLFFGGISVFISMIGGQVITIIVSIAIVFVMCLMNFLYPQVTSSATDVLSNKYDAEVLSYSCNTLSQYNNSKSNQQPVNFAAIQCAVNDNGKEEFHYDTKEYWDIASRESGLQATNYIDFGKQLSNLYSSFGLDSTKLQEASKLVIGANSSYNYLIDENTHITNKENIIKQNYPISFYSIKQSQGKLYPIVNIVGANMGLDTSNWYLLSTLWQIDFNSTMYVSTSIDSMAIPDSLWEKYKTPWVKLENLHLIKTKQIVAKALYQVAKAAYKEAGKNALFPVIANAVIRNDISGWFFEQGKFDELDNIQKLSIIFKIHFYWAIQAQEDQIENINSYCTAHNIKDSFPYSSRTINEWYLANVSPTNGEYKYAQKFNNDIYTSGIFIDSGKELTSSAFTKLVTAKMEYAETFNNLYQYSVKSFYNITSIIAVWTIISCALFTTSVIVYKKTDFK